MDFIYSFIFGDDATTPSQLPCWDTSNCTDSTAGSHLQCQTSASLGKSCSPSDPVH